ncbi:MAG: LCP family protein [Clostridiaceae bacterium]|nr:LCP family protein [Clostridiaceae bacterium]
MNFKVFVRLVLLIAITFTLVAGVVAGGVALSYRIAGNEEQMEPEFSVGESSDDVVDEQEEVTDDKEYKVINFLILGVDKDGYRTDTIILAQYNEKTKQVNMLQIPRDTKIETNRSDKKINSAYAFGKEQELFKAIKNLLGVEVDKYILLNYKGFRELIDEIGGVKIYVPINMDYDDPVQGLSIKLKKGEQVLDGAKAEQFVRFRQNNDGTGYPEGDLGRVKAQQQFINAVIEKVFSMRNIFKIPRLVSVIVQNVKTNFTIQEIWKYVDDALQLDRNKINMFILPGEGLYIGDISYFIHDKEETEKLINEYFLNEEDDEEGMKNDQSVNTSEIIPEQEKSTSLVDTKKDYKGSWINRFIKVEVINGTENDEYFDETVKYLKDKGFKVVNTGKLEGVFYNKTKIIDRSSKGFSKEVSKALGNVETAKDIDKSSEVDVTVIIGEDMEELLKGGKTV